MIDYDPETLKGDYAEAYQHMIKMWHDVPIDQKFEVPEMVKCPRWEKFKEALIKEIENDKPRSTFH